MESKNMIGGIVSLAVVVICVAAIMMPVLNDATTTHNTFDNTEYAYYQMKELEVGDVWTRTDGTWYYGDTALTSSSQGTVSVVVTDDCTFRQNGQIRGTGLKGNSVSSVEVTTSDDIEVLEVNGDTANYHNFESGYGAVTEGDYVLKTYTDAAYVNGDTNLWVTGVTDMSGVSTSAVIIHIEGTIDDGLTITGAALQGGTTTDIEIGEYTLNYEEVDGYEDLYKVTSAQFTISGIIGDATEATTVNATYSTFVIPKEVTAELSQHFNDSEIALLNAIPVLVIVALVISAIGIAINSRRD